MVTAGCLLAVPVAVTKYLKVPIAQSHLTIASFYIICLTIPVVTLTGTFRGYFSVWPLLLHRRGYRQWHCLYAFRHLLFHGWRTS